MGGESGASQRAAQLILETAGGTLALGGVEPDGGLAGDDRELVVQRLDALARGERRRLAHGPAQQRAVGDGIDGPLQPLLGLAQVHPDRDVVLVPPFLITGFDRS